MISEILSRTPTWVFVLFAVLLVLGLVQSRARQSSLTRLAIMPIALTALSVFGMVMSFKASLLGMSVWITVTAIVALLIPRFKPTSRASYNPICKLFLIPGSWSPLALIMAIFVVKYGVGVSLGMNRALANDTSFMVSVCAINGLLNGILIARFVGYLNLRRDASAVSRSALLVST